MATEHDETPITPGDDPKNPFFEALARRTVRHPWLALVLTLACTGGFATLAATRLQMDNSVEAFTSSASDAREILERFRDDFGRDDFFLVMVEGDVFSRPYLERLRKLHDELATLDMEIPSLGQRKARREPAVSGHAPILPERRATPKRAPTAQAEAQAGPPPDAGAPAAAADDPFADFATEGAAAGGEAGEATPAAAAATGDGGGKVAWGSFGEEGEDLGWGDEAGGTIVDEITSILNVRRTQAVGDGIRIGGWLEPLPEPAALPALRDAILAEPTLVGQVVGAAGKHSVITMRTAFMSEDDSSRVYWKVMEICQRHRAPGFEPHVAGPPALGAAINDIILGDLRRTGVVAVIAMLSALAFLFRHPMGIVGPLLVVGQAAIWTFGLMAAVGWPMTMLSNILPAFLVCVGIGDSVHIQSVYRDARRRGHGNDDAIVYAISTTGVPVLFTTLTTMVGLLSFRFATVDAIGEMGTAGAFGVVVALVHSVIFLPAFLTFNRKSLLGATAAGGGAALDRMLDTARLFSADAGAPAGGLRGAPRRVRTLALGVVLALAAVAGMSGLRVYHNPLSWIPPSFPVRPAFDLIDEHVGGTANVQLLIEAKDGRTIKDLQLMQGLEKLLEHVREYRYPGTEMELVGNAISLIDVVKETNRALHDGDPGYYRLPKTERGLSDLLFLFENAGPDQLRRLATNDLRKTQVTIRVRWVDATSYGPFTEHLTAGIERHIGDRAKVEKTGAVYSLFNIVSSIIADLIRSFMVAFLIITVMMVLMLRNLRLGLIAMVPNLLPIAMIMGIMGVFRVPIDMSNLLIASIAIGIAVDDTIHFLHHFQARYLQSGDVEESIRYTFHHSGRAMFSTSVILAMGFCVYVSAQMENLARFGVLVALTVVMALVIDLIFAPALLRWAYRDRKEASR